jgi:hypothetical protein
MGIGGSFAVGKQLGCEADHSLPPSVEVKKISIYEYICSLQYAFMA